MHGDFSKFGFRPDQRYSAVLAQQGRVQLDSEANEHTLIQLHHARTLATDLIGPHGGPSSELGFKISTIDAPNELPDLKIEGGRYYVDGILVDATKPETAPVVDATPHTEAPLPHWTYWDQPDAFHDKETDADKLPTTPHVVYLKVNERMVTFLQDPLVRETALGTALPDTTTRTKVTWQVLPFSGTLEQFETWVGAQKPTARMAARTKRPAKAEENPCLAAADARYRGAENQLYRVEVHKSGDEPTFKWSRENGSVSFGIASISENIVTLTDRGRDDKLDLAVGDWVEIVDDASTARGTTTALLRVVDVDTERLRVEFAGERTSGVGELTVRHPFLRRWDHPSQNADRRRGMATRQAGPPTTAAAGR